MATKTRKRSTGKKGYVYGLFTIGITRIFARDKVIHAGKEDEFTITEYTVSISKKDENGKYKNLYIPVFFGKNDERPENNTLIRVIEGRLFVSGNKGYERIGLFVKTWDYIEEE